MSATSQIPNAGVRPLRILCADDNELLGDVMLCLFARAGHWVEHAGGGLEAWDRVSRDMRNFDVIVTDHQMPGLNGLELVELLRQANYRGRIVVHSSGFGPEIADRYRSLGVDSILMKAARPEELLRVVERSACLRVMNLAGGSKWGERRTSLFAPRRCSHDKLHIESAGALRA